LCIRTICALAVLAVLASPAAAIEFWEGRFSIHGYYETQIRSIVRDYSFDDDWDLTQWYHILNLEMEAEIAPDGFGPFDLISAFGRVEVRYDCVWNRGCGIFSSADAYGDRANRLPKRVLNGRRSGYTMQEFTGNTRKYREIRYDQMGVDYRYLPDPARRPIPFPNIPGLEGLSASKGPDRRLLGDDNPRNALEGLSWDDPFPFYTGGSLIRGFESGFMNPSDCKWGVQATKGSFDGVGTRNLPWTPKCKVRPIAAMWNRPNPMRGVPADVRAPDPLLDDFNPILGEVVDAVNGDFTPIPSTWQPGFGRRPLRPAPELGWEDPYGGGDVAQGLWMPNERLAELLRDGEFDNADQNFRQAELEWNRGASQQDEKELKELYFDLELFDSRLWLRLGKQTIVWGKTELFRTTDQFNPTDLALASLPSLEESRIALWAARAVWSFYNVGPLEDLRFEVAVNYDQFEPMDLGRCGEPYAPLPVCDKTWGLMAHGFVGDAIAGEIRPPNPWNSWKGIEVGGRLEWRWDRFSFAVTNFYGFNDTPYVDPIFSYSRNVDPLTGRPRVGMSTGKCETDWTDPNVEPDPDCLTGRLVDPVTGQVIRESGNALAHHSVNQTQFAFICATSIGFLPNLDPTACGQTIYSSQQPVILSGEPFNPLLPRIMIAVTNGLSGQNNPLTGGAAVMETVPGFTKTGADILVDPPSDWGTIEWLEACQLGDERTGCTNADLQRFTSLDFGVDTPTPVVPLSHDGLDIDGLPLLVSDLPDYMIQPSVTFWAWTGVDRYLTDEQEALLGCGAFYGTRCDREGIDLMNIETSVHMWSFPDFEGTFGPGLWLTTGMFDPDTGAELLQPGTWDPVTGETFDGGPACTQYQGDTLYILPGCRGEGYNATTVRAQLEAAGITGVTVVGDYDINVDGSTTGPSSVGTLYPAGRRHPFTGQVWSSEMAILSWNMMMVLIGLSSPPDEENGGIPPGSLGISYFDPEQPFREDGCSFAAPAFCSNLSAYNAISGVRRNSVRAGGNGRFGRRDFLWTGGGDMVLRYEKRNVLGFSMDFAEDFTKSNWGLEFTWIEGLPFTNNNSFDAASETDVFNLTVSVDRPSFINFLNQNRTFFFNSQWFFRYKQDYEKGFTSNGPWEMLATFTVMTGYFQDRLLPGVTFVYDFGSNSGAALPSVTYRFTENFSASFGLAGFWGRYESRSTPFYMNGLDNRVGEGAYSSYVENGLSAVRERDEAYLRIRYTF